MEHVAEPDLVDSEQRNDYQFRGPSSGREAWSLNGCVVIESELGGELVEGKPVA
jgi:hypothetical protein